MERQQPHKQTTGPPGAEERRYVVAQATGVLMSRFGITSDDASKRLAAIAADEGRHVGDVAREIVEQLGR